MEEEQINKMQSKLKAMIPVEPFPSIEHLLYQNGIPLEGPDILLPSIETELETILKSVSKPT